MHVRLECPSVQFGPYVQILELFWEYRLASDASDKQVPEGPDAELLPYTLRDQKVWRNAHSLPGVAPNKYIFLATDLHGKQQIVKFVQRYGTETHRSWAAAGLAPELLAEPIAVGGGWKQIQMEFLPMQLSDNSGWVPLRWLMRSQ